MNGAERAQKGGEVAEIKHTCRIGVAGIDGFLRDKRSLIRCVDTIGMEGDERLDPSSQNARRKVRFAVSLPSITGDWGRTTCG